MQRFSKTWPYMLSAQHRAIFLFNPHGKRHRIHPGSSTFFNGSVTGACLPKGSGAQYGRARYAWCSLLQHAARQEVCCCQQLKLQPQHETASQRPSYTVKHRQLALHGASDRARSLPEKLLPLRLQDVFIWSQTRRHQLRSNHVKGSRKQRSNGDRIARRVQ